MNEDKINFFRKNRLILSVLFAISITFIYMFITSDFLNSLGFAAIALGPFAYLSAGLVLVVPGAILYKKLAPITPEEKIQSELQNKKTIFFLKCICIIIIIITFSYIFRSYYTNFK